MDRLLIFLLSAVLISFIFDESSFLLIFYALLFFTSIEVFFISNKTINLKYFFIIIEILASVFALLKSQYIGVLPIFAYTAYLLKNYVFFGISFIACIRAVGQLPDEKMQLSNGKSILMFYIGFCIFGIILATILSHKQDKLKKVDSLYKKTRDDGEEVRFKLKVQNRNLLEALDRDIETGKLEERNRIAREIHDNVGHMLSRALLQMGALLTIYKEDPLHSQLEDVRKTLDSSLSSIRTSVHDLHDDSILIEPTVNELVKPLYQSYNVYLEIDISEDVSRDIKYAIIGIVREGISNIIKYSKNPNVDIKINEHPSFYQIVIHDYPDKESGEIDLSNNSDRNFNRSFNNNFNNNFNSHLDITDKNTNNNTNITINKNTEYNHNSSAGNTGIGLENIRERADKLGGSVYITSGDDFKIFVSIPKEK